MSLAIVATSTHLNISQFELKIVDLRTIASIQRLADDKYGFDVLNGKLGIATSSYHPFASRNFPLSWAHDSLCAHVQLWTKKTKYLLQNWPKFDTPL